MVISEQMQSIDCDIGRLLSLFLRPNKIGPNKIDTFNSCYNTIIDKLISFGRCCGNHN